jgi:integrase
VNITLKTLLRRLTRKAGLPEIRFHDLRHTCATPLLSKNVHPKMVQEMLGTRTWPVLRRTASVPEQRCMLQGLDLLD